ncbi:hypothetical protein C8034_v009083 [Colletotrichum sidae]|uniref:Uncharacterized protein n=1 Tax=Colletotrichum sidae TaxID=1347389 RepID=A0A4R8TGN2_9PEZI|nr:hypothetical protein C8034_v009083 [Colletotrichum sidae]
MLTDKFNKADKEMLGTVEDMASKLVEVFSDVQRAESSATRAATLPDGLEGLEGRLTSRLDRLEGTHREDIAKQDRRIEDLIKTLGTEVAQRRALSLENEKLKTRLTAIETSSRSMSSTVEKHKKAVEAQFANVDTSSQSISTKVEEHTRSMEHLQDIMTTPRPNPNLPSRPLDAQYIEEIRKVRMESRCGFNELRGEMSKLKTKLAEVDTIVSAHDTKLGEMDAVVSDHDIKLGDLDAELINDSCSAVTSTLPKCQQDISGLRSDVRKLESTQERFNKDAQQLERLEHSQSQLGSRHEQLKSEHEKLVSGYEKLESGHRELMSEFQEKFVPELDSAKTGLGQLFAETKQAWSSHEQIVHLLSDMETLRTEQNKLRSDLEAPRHDKADKSEQVSTSVEALRASLNELQSAVEVLGSKMQQKPSGDDSFVLASVLKEFNTPILKRVSDWVEELKKRATALEQQVGTMQTALDNPRFVELLSNLTTSVTDTHIPELKVKLDKHDERIKALEGASTTDISRTVEQANAARGDATSRAIETLKKQMEMNEQSIKGVQDSIQSIRGDLSTHSERINDIESNAKCIDGIETETQKLRADLAQESEMVNKKLGALQHCYKDVDTRMNNLVTQELFTLILQYIENYRPSEAQLGQLVETLQTQVRQQELRLVKVERSSDSSSGEEPAAKKRKYMTNGMVGFMNGHH